MSSQDSSDRLGGVLGALADPTRRSLYEQLAAHGPETATNLAHGLPVTRQAVVKHLQVLTGAGLVERARDGREVRYAVDPQGLDEVAAWMEQAAAGWDRRLARLRSRFQPRRAE